MKIIFAICLCILVFAFPLQAEEPDSLLEIEYPNDAKNFDEKQVPEIEAPRQISQIDLDELLGPDPYLGQTDWLSGKKINKTHIKN